MKRDEFILLTLEEQNKYLTSIIAEYNNNSMLGLWISHATNLGEAWKEYIKNGTQIVESEITLYNCLNGMDILFVFNEKDVKITRIKFWEDGKRYDETLEQDTWDDLEMDGEAIYFELENIIFKREMDNDINVLFGNLEKRITWFFNFCGYKYGLFETNDLKHKANEVIEDFYFCGEKSWETIFGYGLKEAIYPEDDYMDYQEPSRIYAVWGSDDIMFIENTRCYDKTFTNYIVFSYSKLKCLSHRTSKMVYEMYLDKFYEKVFFRNFSLGEVKQTIKKYNELLADIIDSEEYIVETIETIREITEVSYEYGMALVSKMIIFMDIKILLKHFDDIMKLIFWNLDENYDSAGLYVSNISFIFKWANTEYYSEYFVQFLPKRIKAGISRKNERFTNVFIYWLKEREADYRDLAAEVCYALDTQELKLFLDKIDSKKLVSYLRLKVFKNEQR